MDNVPSSNVTDPHWTLYPPLMWLTLTGISTLFIVTHVVRRAAALKGGREDPLALQTTISTISWHGRLLDLHLKPALAIGIPLQLLLAGSPPALRCWIW